MGKVKTFLQENKGKFSVPLVLLLIMLLFTCLTDSFLTVSNLINLLRQSSVLCIICCGVSLTMIGGGVDLCAGAIVSFCGVAWAQVYMATNNLFLACVCAVIAGGCLGFINGVIIAYTGMQPMIATIGTATALSGITFITCNGGAPIFGFPSESRIIGQGSIFGIPTAVLIMFVCLLINWIILKRTSMGRSLYARGNNIVASNLSGIHTKKVAIFSYVCSGCFAAVASIVLTTRIFSAQPSAGDEFQMDALIASVVGGISFGGGEGNTVMVFLGAMLLGTVDNGCTILQIPDFWKQVIRGAILIIAVVLDVYQRNAAIRTKKIKKVQKLENAA